MTDKEAFLSRWSQRKRQIAEEARKAAEAVPATTPEPESEDEPFDLSLLPDLEVLTAQTDMSLFLRKGVPDELRNAALRKIWALDPAIRDYVGDALDYAWDWNAPGGVPGGGALGAGFDTAKMVAQIFGDEPADKNVIEDAAPQQERAGGRILHRSWLTKACQWTWLFRKTPQGHAHLCRFSLSWSLRSRWLHRTKIVGTGALSPQPSLKV